MGFFIFLFVVNLFLPVIMLIFGVIFEKHPPKSVNGAYGYRTTRSMKNQETWDFAHKLFGEIWKKAGTVLSIITISVTIASYPLGEDGIGIVSLVLVHIQLVVLLLCIYPVEKALKKNFDENGKRRK